MKLQKDSGLNFKLGKSFILMLAKIAVIGNLYKTDAKE